MSIILSLFIYLFTNLFIYLFIYLPYVRTRTKRIKYLLQFTGVLPEKKQTNELLIYGIMKLHARQNI